MIPVSVLTSLMEQHHLLIPASALGKKIRPVVRQYVRFSVSFLLYNHLHYLIVSTGINIPHTIYFGQRTQFFISLVWASLTSSLLFLVMIATPALCTWIVKMCLTQGPLVNVPHMVPPPRSLRLPIFPFAYFLDKLTLDLRISYSWRHQATQLNLSQQMADRSSINGQSRFCSEIMIPAFRY